MISNPDNYITNGGCIDNPNSRIYVEYLPNEDFSVGLHISARYTNHPEIFQISNEELK